MEEEGERKADFRSGGVSAVINSLGVDALTLDISIRVAECRQAFLDEHTDENVTRSVRQSSCDSFFRPLFPLCYH